MTTAKFYYRLIWLPFGDAKDTDSIELDDDAEVVSQQLMYGDNDRRGVEVLVRQWQRTES